MTRKTDNRAHNNFTKYEKHLGDEGTFYKNNDSKDGVKGVLAVIGKKQIFAIVNDRIQSFQKAHFNGAESTFKIKCPSCDKQLKISVQIDSEKHSKDHKKSKEGKKESSGKKHKSESGKLTKKSYKTGEVVEMITNIAEEYDIPVEKTKHWNHIVNVAKGDL